MVPTPADVVPTPAVVVPTPAAAVSVQKQKTSDFIARIEGDVTQVLHVTIKTGQKVLAEPGTMI